MEPINPKRLQDPQKSECMCESEKMNEEQDNETEAKTQGKPSKDIINQPQNTTKNY